VEWVFTTADLPDWSVDPSDYEHTASMTGVLFFDGMQSEDPNDMVAAFVGDEVRGVDAQGIYFPPSDQWIWGITLHANDEGESFTFRGYDASSDSVYDYSSFSYVFVADDIVGSAEGPVEWNFTSEPPVVPTVTITDPSDGSALDSEDFFVEYLTTDFTIGAAGCGDCDGHVHIFVDGVPNPYGDYMVYAEGPVFLSGVPNGDHSITVQLVDTAHQPFDPSIESTVGVSVFVNSAPVAEDDLYETDEDALLNGNVLENDSDIDDDLLTAVLVTGTSSGTLDLSEFGSFTYMPNENFNGSDQFTYQADDGAELSCEDLGFDYTDCVGTCFNNADCVNDDTDYDGCVEGETTWIGDGYCDDGNWGLVFLCDDYGWDCGDCGDSGPDPNGYCDGRTENDDSGENNKIFVETGVNTRDLSNVATVTITVVSVYDTMTINLPDSFTFEEDSSLVEDFAQYIGGEDDLILTVSGNENISVAIDGLAVTFGASQEWSGSETLWFTVDDGIGEAVSDSVVIIVTIVNDPPVANAGEDIFITVLPGAEVAEVTLDGSGSYDIDDNIVQYRWWSALYGNLAFGEIVTVTLGTNYSPQEVVLYITSENGASSSDIVTVFIEQSETAWTPPTPTDQYHLIVLGDISVGLDSPDPGLDEIGVFDGELLVGAVIYSGESGQQILAWADDETTEEVDGFTEGHVVTFKYFDFSESVIMDVIIAEYIEFPGWTTDGLFGSGHVSGVDLAEFSHTLPDEWSWKGFPVLPENPITAEEFFGPVLDNVVIVKSQEDGSMVNIEGSWAGGDFVINKDDGYIIKMSSDASFNHPDQVRIDPYETLEMDSSWNWINYYGLGAPDAVLAFDNILDDLIVAESRDGALLDTPWGLINGIGNMEFTEGYLIKLSDSGSLIWPNGSSARTLASAMDVSPTQESSHFMPIKTRSYHLINVRWEGYSGINYGDEIAVFSDDICVGSVVFDGNNLQQVLAWKATSSQADDGFQPGKIIRFIHWNGIEEKDLSNEISYVDFDGWSADGMFKTGGMSGVNITDHFLPEKIHLIGNFPNPFNPSTTIKYELTHNADVSLVVYNLLGEVVQILVNSSSISGRHSVLWNGNSISGGVVPSGIYIYQLTVDGVISGTKKMVLVK
jgi:hypothetical protein